MAHVRGNHLNPVTLKGISVVMVNPCVMKGSSSWGRPFQQSSSMQRQPLSRTCRYISTEELPVSCPAKHGEDGHRNVTGLPRKEGGKAKPCHHQERGKKYRILVNHRLTQKLYAMCVLCQPYTEYLNRHSLYTLNL